MNRILKYPLKLADRQTITLPANTRILSVENQRGSVVMYALVDCEATDMRVYTIKMIGTGHYADSVVNSPFIGTVNLENGSLMFHVFVDGVHDVQVR